jgi:hypothetical protein
MDFPSCARLPMKFLSAHKFLSEDLETGEVEAEER